MKHLILFPLLLVAVASYSAEFTECESIRDLLNSMKASQLAEMKQARRVFIERECGPEGASWIGGAAGSRRYQYMSCMSSAKRKFKKKWAIRASQWGVQIDKVKAHQGQVCND